MVFNKNNNNLVMYTAIISTDSNIYLFGQIHVTLLDIKKFTIFPKYTDYIYVFLPDSALEQSEYIGIDNYLISLVYDCLLMLPYCLFARITIAFNLASEVLKRWSLKTSIYCPWLASLNFPNWNINFDKRKFANI